VLDIIDLTEQFVFYQIVELRFEFQTEYIGIYIVAFIYFMLLALKMTLEFELCGQIKLQ